MDAVGKPIFIWINYSPTDRAWQLPPGAAETGGGEPPRGRLERKAGSGFWGMALRKMASRK